MATQEYKVKAPDGQTITLRGPSGASQEQVIAQAKRLYAAQQAAPAEASPPAPDSMSAQTAIDPRQAIAEQAMQRAEQGGEPAPDDIAQASQRESALREQVSDQRGTLQKVGDVFTGADRQTPEAQALPELEGLLQDQGFGDALKFAGLQLVTPNDEEMAKVLKARNPNLEFSRDEAGNLIGSDPTTGARALVNAPGLSLPDIGQLAAGALAFTPAGRLAEIVGGGIATQAAALGIGSAATQAVIEGAQAAGGGDFNAEDVAISGALGAAAPIAAGAIGAGVDTAKRGVQALRNAPASQSEIVQAAKQANIPLMTTDVAQPETFIGKSAQTLGERIPLAGTGGLRADQQNARQAAVQALGADYPTPQPSQIIDSLKAQASRVKKAAGKRYDELLPKIEAVGAVGYGKTSSAIDDAIAELSQPGVVSSGEAVAELQRFKQALNSTDQTYSTLRKNRSELRDVIKSYDSPLRSQMPTRAKSLLNRVYGSFTDDMNDAAKAALSPRDFGRLKEADAIYASEAERLTKTRLKSVLDKGDLTPEVAETLLFSTKRSDVKNLYESLTPKGREAVRATLVQRAINKAGGLDDVSPDKFLNELRRLESQTGVVFKGDQRKQIEGLKQVLAATKRAGQAGVQTASGQQLYAPVGAAAAGSLIGDFGTTMAAGATAGALARIYESQVMRNALIRIGSAPKSQMAKQMALTMARELNAGVQAGRAQTTGEKEPQEIR
jgi:hypothetical protein